MIQEYKKLLAYSINMDTKLNNDWQTVPSENAEMIFRVVQA